MGLEGWEARMAARAAERRQQAEARQAEARQQEWEQHYGHLPSCPCPYDPCPNPPDLDEDWLWQSHREYFAEWRQTGRCPSCDQLLPTDAAMIEHDCPNVIALAAS